MKISDQKTTNASAPRQGYFSLCSERQRGAHRPTTENKKCGAAIERAQKQLNHTGRVSSISKSMFGHRWCRWRNKGLVMKYYRTMFGTYVQMSFASSCTINTDMHLLLF